MFVVIALIVFRIGSYIPVPGVNPQAMLALMEGQQGTIVDMFNMFSGGALQRFSLLAEQYRAAPQVTRKRLMLETMQDVLAGSPKVMASGDGDKVLYLPLDKIGAPLLPPVTGEVATPTERMGASAVPAVEATRNRDSGRSGREGRDR